MRHDVRQSFPYYSVPVALQKMELNRHLLDERVFYFLKLMKPPHTVKSSDQIVILVPDLKMVVTFHHLIVYSRVAQYDALKYSLIPQSQFLRNPLRMLLVD